MDDELLELQRQFEFAQQAKSSVLLSERNVVELVQKLQELHIIDFELLHTVSGKEYITPEHLRSEILALITKLRRVSLIDLADTIGVDLYHVERQAQQVVLQEPGLTMIQGEVISESYWDSVAEEINERLQESSQIALSELAAQLQVGSELVASFLEPRLGGMVKGRLEGGQLYTPAYVARVTAMVRGAARGITIPTNLSALWSILQHLLKEMEGASGVAVDGSFLQSLFNGLLKEGDFLGTLRAGLHWSPLIFSAAQKECVDSFFSQNSFISYETLNKLGIPQPVQYLQSRYPEGILLETAFVHPSKIEMLDAAIEDAIERGSWIDSLSLLPASFGSHDASKIVSLCPSLQAALKANKVIMLGGSYIFSNGFVKDVCNQLEKEAETFISDSSSILMSDVKDPKSGFDSNRFAETSETSSESGYSKRGTDKGSRKKRGKASGTKVVTAGDDSETEDFVPMKAKKKEKKGKDTSSLSRTRSRKELEEENVPSVEWMVEKLTVLFRDFEEQGVEDTHTISRLLVNHMRPSLINYVKERRKALFTENSEKMKSVLDNLQKKLDESFLNMQLYEKALDMFEDDQSTSAVLHRHLLRTKGASLADMLFRDLATYNRLKNGFEVGEPEKSESVSLSPAERNATAKSFPGSLSKKAVSVVEALEGKRVETFISAFREMTEESGQVLKKLDKKLERSLLYSYRKDLLFQVSAETDPVALLPKVVCLLYLQVYNKALQAPGRAISVAVTRLKDKLDDSAYKVLVDYQTATVTFLALMSAKTGDEHDCSSDRILSKRELLESQIPALKSLVLDVSKSQN